MLRGLFGAILFLLLAPSLWATTSVTGSIKNLGTGAVTPGSFVRFWLRGCAGNQPRINGTGVIAPSQGGVFFFDIAADASGNISGTVYSTRDNAGTGNGDIECGGSKIAVWYGMQIFNAGKGGPEIPIHALNAATLDITQVTPITTNPVVTSPTGDTTYGRLDGGNTPFTGNIHFSNGLTSGNTNSVLWVDGTQYTTIAAAVTAAGSNPRIIIVPSTYAGTECASSPAATLYFWDFRNFTGTPNPCGANTDSYNGITSGGVQSFLRHSWTLAVPSVSRSYELTTNVASYSGSLPGSGNSLEGVTSVAVITGTPTFAGTTLNLVGLESHAYTQSTGGTLPNAYGFVTSAGQQSGTTNITTAAGILVQTNQNAGGTLTNSYGIFMQNQTVGATRNFSFYSQGAGLFSSDAGGSGINFEDSALATHPILTAISSTNQMRFRPLLDTAGFCFDNLNSTADWLCAKSTGVSIPTVGLSIGGGTNLTTSNQTGTGSIVLATSPSITTPTLTSPTIGTGIPNDGSGFKHKRGASNGCATGAAAGAACTVTVTWTTTFADANYTAMCGGRGVTSGVPVNGGITAQIAASVTFQTVAGTAAAAQYTNIDCTAVHD